MNVETLLGSILRDKMEMLKNNIPNVLLLLPKHNYDLIKTYYEEIINLPVTSIIIDKIEFPLNTVFGMAISITNLQIDYMLIPDWGHKL